MTTTIPIRERITCTIAEACSFSGLGRTTIYARIQSGELIIRKVGRRTLILIDSLVALLDAAPADTPSRQPKNVAAHHEKESRR